MKYVDFDDVKRYGYQFDESTDGSLLADLIDRASALFDTLCNAPPGYFKPDTISETPSPKTFYGSGSMYLNLPPYVGSIVKADVGMPTGYTVPDFRVVDNSLRITDSLGVVHPMDWSNIWPNGVPVVVTARWGREKTPDDVKEAVAELAIAMWRGRDHAFLKAIQMDNQQIINEAIPKRVKVVAAHYRGSWDGPAFV